MIIKKLELENIRSHAHLELNFEDGITVITGRTGSGKSTILMSVECALFGMNAGVNYDSMLRRGAENGRITLSFSHESDDYEITRGFKRGGSGISFNKDLLSLKVNGEIVPVIERVKDFDEKIRQLTGYDSNIFSVMSYTRQDEIRKLIELKEEARQEYIDKILQLSKYKDTWENLKEVVSHYESEISRASLDVSRKESAKKELSELENEIKTKQERIKQGLEELSKAKLKASLLEQKFLQEKKNKQEAEKIFEELVARKKEGELLKQRLKTLSVRENELKSLINPAQIDLKKLVEEFESAKKQKYAASTLLEQKREDASNFTNVGMVCPTCKQAVSQEHLEKVMSETLKEISKLETLEKEFGQEESRLKEEVGKAQTNAELLRRLDELEKEKLEIKSAEIFQDETDYEARLRSARSRYEEAYEEYGRESSAVQALTSNLKTLSEVVAESENRIASKRLFVQELEEKESKLETLKERHSLVSKLRNDLRNIREEVRANFLESFKEEFQKRFEEIRKDDDYSVEILNNYQPIAYSSNGFETQIASLSGGEKTSVALAYRIALSNIASEVAELSQSELLIMDEPTLGFDSEDVKALPEILERIRIKQILIVTHEEELKSSASKHYRVDKVNGKSVVE